MKKSCDDCRALDTRNKRYICDLGFEIEEVYWKTHYKVGAKPLEECPKPKTYNKFYELLDGK